MMRVDRAANDGGSAKGDVTKAAIVDAAMRLFR